MNQMQRIFTRKGLPPIFKLSKEANFSLNRHITLQGTYSFRSNSKHYQRYRLFDKKVNRHFQSSSLMHVLF